ncbi:MAG: THUMP domain-containing class I SAM-dependent RNA methyltransferase [Lachnospiraceae bacterium]|jgi:putative N6-adenine-specific DNA methylase
MKEKTFQYIVPCHFGTESVLKREILNLGYEIDSVQDGRVFFSADEKAIARANIFLRTAERVLLCVGIFQARTFDELFEGTKALPWADYIPKNGRFWVKKASTKNSRLFSSSDIQSIVKKAIVNKLHDAYHISWFEENGDDYPLRVFILNDVVTIAIDTTGESLHKRGYRRLAGAAPLSETLAAALIMLTPWHADRILVDPFCGSGTIPIEAAMIGANIAPGMNRSFTAENWGNIIPKKDWYEAVTEADDLIRTDVEMNIQGYDIDNDVIHVAMNNAREAGVDRYIHFQQRDVRDLHNPKKYGFIITNPPYGERLEDKETLPALYRQIGESYRGLDSWSMFIITSYEDAQKYIGRKADRNRKIYNGMIKTYYYQYMGPKPPRRRKERTESQR